MEAQAARADYPIYKRDRIIMDEERVLSAIEEAGCELSRVSIAEHLREKPLSTNGRMPRSAKVASRDFDAVHRDV